MLTLLSDLFHCIFHRCDCDFGFSKGVPFHSFSLSNPRWRARNEDERDRGGIMHEYTMEGTRGVVYASAAPIRFLHFLPRLTEAYLGCVIDVCELKSIFYYQLSPRALSSVSPGTAFIYSSDSRGIKGRSVEIISSLRWKSESRNRTDVLIRLSHLAGYFHQMECYINSAGI